MKPKQAWMFFAAVAAAVALIAAYQLGLKPRMEKKTEESARFFPGLNLDAVTRMEIVKGDSVTALLRDGSTAWFVETGGKYPADSDMVNRALEPLKELKKSMTAAESKANHERLGVADTGRRLKVIQGQTTVVDLIIGNQGSSYSTCFVREPKSDKVYLISENLNTSFDRQPMAWRDKRVFDFTSDQVVQIELTSWPEASEPEPGNTVETAPGNSVEPAPGNTIEPAPGNTSEPEPARAVVYRKAKEGSAWEMVDGDSVKVLTDAQGADISRKLGSLRATDFADAATPDETGLDKPSYQIKVKLIDGREYTLIAGAKKDAAYYARRADRPQIMMVSDWNINNLFDPPAEESGMPSGFDPSSMLPTPNLPQTDPEGGMESLPPINEGTTAETATVPAPEPEPAPAPDEGNTAGK